MTEHIKTDDVVYFTANFYHPVSGFSSAADHIPRWFVYEDDYFWDLIDGEMSERSGVVGSYRGHFTASAAQGFDTNSFYDVQVSGTVAGVSGFTSVKQFVLDDIFDANVVQVSGEYVHLDDFKADVSGLSTFNVETDAVAVSGIVQVDVVQVSGVYIHSDLTNVSSQLTAVKLTTDKLDSMVEEIP